MDQAVLLLKIRLLPVAMFVRLRVQRGAGSNSSGDEGVVLDARGLGPKRSQLRFGRASRYVGLMEHGERLNPFFT